jgi:hypothetical protein
VGLALGYFVAVRGPSAAGVVLGLVCLVALVVVGLNRLHLTLLPLAVILPLAGYLIILRPEAGFSLVYDILALVPFAALVVRWVARPHDVSLFSGLQLLVWGFLLVTLFQFANPDGTNLTVSLHGFRRMVVPMLLFFVAYHIRTIEPGRLRRFGWALLITGWIPALWGIKQYVLGLTATEQQYAKQITSGWVGQDVRVFGTFAGPWGLAAYLGGLALISLSLAAAARTRGPRVVAVLAFALATLALAFTYVRGCLLGYLVGVGFLLFVFLGSRIGMRRVAILFLAVLASYVAFALFVGPLILEHISVDNVAVRRALTILAPSTDFAVQARLVTWSMIQDLVVRYPLGIGLGSTAGVSARFQSQLRFGPVHPDNSYLGVALETGCVGAILFVAIVIRLLITGIRMAGQRSTRSEQWVLRGAVAYLIMMAIASLAAPLLFESGAGHLYWLVAGVIAREGAGLTRPLTSARTAGAGLGEPR